MSGRDADRGTTLIELMVTMMVMGIVSVLVSGTLISAFNSTTRMQRTSAAIADARLISASLDRELRSALCISAPAENQSGNTLSFVTLANGVQTSLTYVVGSGRVTRQVGLGPPQEVITNVGTTSSAFTQVVTPLRTVKVRIVISSANGGLFTLQTTIAGRNVWRSC
jgi:prepilin-type N-terminal cleavage/methylation domain-containing protein